MSVRILVVDDDPTIRMLVGRLLRKQSGWEPCGEASNGAEAIEKVEELSPDVVVMDLGMPIMTGLQAARTIAHNHPRLPMLMMSVQEVSNALAFEARMGGSRVPELSARPDVPAEAQIKVLFEHFAQWLHLRHAEAGCFIARVDRA